MLPQEIIRRKRDRQVLTADEIAYFVEGMTSGAISEGQVAAFAMAVYFTGMNAGEASGLTLAMRDSGAVLDWSGLPGPVVDKHSTGGVGDNLSLMLAPILAACGAYIPMISGRGLGHTGGTLDKMDAIPGYISQPDLDRFRQTVAKAGCAIIGQTANLAPADRRFYSIRDVTATVESIPLITASILSKKLAAGLQGLVLDVKVGNGAFMTKTRDAVKLARSLVDVAGVAGMKTSALLTDMNEPLADAAGNAVEVRAAVNFLTGRKRGKRMETIVLSLATEMLMAAGLATTDREGKTQAQAALYGGAATERFARMVHQLGGPTDFVERMDARLPSARSTRPVLAGKSGYVSAIQTRTIGLAVVELGGGRIKPDDRVDPAVGVSCLLPIGSRVHKGDRMAMVHAQDDGAAERASLTISEAYSITQTRPVRRKPILRRITQN